MTITVRPLAEGDLAEATRVHNFAFGTFVGAKDPARFRETSDAIGTRWRADPGSAFGAFDGNRLVGSVVATCWGSFGVLGPITVHPDYWSRGIARQLMPPAVDLFDRRGVSVAALVTHPHSPKHLRLYESFGFWPRSLSAVMVRPVDSAADASASLFADLDAARRARALEACRAIADAQFEGLDLTGEIESVAGQGLGDVLLLDSGGDIAGFAVCHHGNGTEAGPGTLYVKSAMVRPERAADFERLLAACESRAAVLALERVEAGVNTARREAYRMMKDRGYRTITNFVAMHRPDHPAFDRAQVFAIDDLR